MIRYLTVFLNIFTIAAFAQIKVNINSGNPAYPFPRFQQYKNPTATLGNLGTNNPCGVTHAEMEKTIRDAYQIMMNRATKPGGGVGGIDYIYFRSSPSCTEGDGYGLLGAVAMADKTTFDGMWLWIHDHAMNKVKRYSDCKESSPGYRYSQLPGWTNSAGANSATDGDVDIALALLCAYYQWGEFMGIEDACGNPISYKQAAIDFITALTDTFTFVSSGSGLLSGDIGLDGYFKGGDSWAELSGWANVAREGFTKRAEQPGPTAQYFDYTAPAYFRAFADFLSKVDSAKYAWNIYQFRRAEASSDWLIGKLYEANPRNLPICGNVSMSDGLNPTFSFTGNMGEDFRLGWRTILNCVWHGNPNSSWNPKTHQVEPNKPNTYEQDMAKRYATFLWDQRQAPWNNKCIPSVGTDPFTHWGPMTLVTNTAMDGTVPADAFYFLNWLPAVGSPSAIISQHFDLMNDLYRYLEIEWDVETPGDGYLTSVPVYYHGWFRLLGLLILTGNYPAPSDIKPGANTKVYLSVDKTFAFEKDTITYSIDWRNYGSLDAQGTVVVDTLHKDFIFVSATNGGVYDNTSHTVTWNIGTLPGFKTATGIPPTTGSAKLKIVIGNATQKQYRNRVSISCANGTGWTSNDYPNTITAVMRRNHVDIARRALIIDQSVSKSFVKPGETVEFTIYFQNSSEAGWLNGGRPGVSFSFSQSAGNGISTMNTMRTRLFHDANEAYIDFGNYRISYFLYDEKDTCIAGTPGCPNGWAFQQTITEGLNKANVKLVHEKIVPGQDERGKWNQRLIVQFSDPESPNHVENLTTIDRHLSGYRGMQGRIHRGGTEPLRLVWFFNSSSWQPVNWSNAWSWDPNISQDDAGYYFPVTNDWADPDKPDVPVDHWNRKACEKAARTVNNILVEEWDGYTWRRVAGNGPMPGREVKNVVIRDTIPEGFTFTSFTGENPLGVAPQINGRVITWSVPRMQIREGGTIKFTAKADGSCPGSPDRVLVNRAWISAEKESPFADSVEIAVSCDTVIKPPPPDHIDIILDTMLIDPSRDHEFVRITMDEGTKDAVAYAVVRDRNGKLIRRVSGALWTSRDITVAEAQAASASSWQGIIVKVGGGSTVIVVSEPGNPDIKPDSLAVTAAATPPWPAITTAVMYDENGDIVPDLLTVTLNDTFHVNQKLDSVIIDYHGKKYEFAASELSLRKEVLNIPFVSLSGADPQPSGLVTMVMTIDGQKVKTSKEFIDGVGPALTAVNLRQDIKGNNDSLKLFFTEDVVMQTLIGPTLQLIKASTGDTVVLTVLSFRGPEIYGSTDVVVATNGNIRPEEGDLVRLVPGVSGGTLVDRKRNLPHALNKPVPIPERPAQLSGGRYVDENADGLVEAVYLQFIKPLPIDSITVSISWAGSQRVDVKSADNFSYTGTERNEIKISLPESYTRANGIKTAGSMFAQVRFTAYVNEIRTGEVIDNAGPVITSATYRIGETTPRGDPGTDTLYVTFSEKVRIKEGIERYFSFIRGNTADYTMSLQLLSVNEQKASFVVKKIEGVDYPENGDSIFINPVSAIGDSLQWQNNPQNRRCVLAIQRGPMKWDVIVTPNPLDPDRRVLDTGCAVIRIVNPVNFNAPVNISDARISIFDAVGNTVVKSEPFRKTPNGLIYLWNGANRKGRKAAEGTYIGVIAVNDEGAKGVKRVKIGVLRTAADAIGQSSAR